MWLLFHRKAKTRPVRDGESFVERCPECGKRATFTEVEIKESFGMFFIDLLGDKQRAYRCGACSEVFDLKDRLPAGDRPRCRRSPWPSSNASVRPRCVRAANGQKPRRSGSRTTSPS